MHVLRKNCLKKTSFPFWETILKINWNKELSFHYQRRQLPTERTKQAVQLIETSPCVFMGLSDLYVDSMTGCHILYIHTALTVSLQGVNPESLTSHCFTVR